MSIINQDRVISPLSKPLIGSPAREDKGPNLVFTNDLTEEDKNEVLARNTEALRKLLAEPTLTVNTVSRILNVQHALASKLCKACPSAKQTLLSWTASTANVRRAKSVLGKLSAEERAELLKQL
jgi:hypothetical protein